MAQIEFSTLLPEVLATAPACPTPTIVRNLRAAARELCEDSDCWRVTLENTVVVANQGEVELSLPTGTTLHRPIVLNFDGERLEPYSVALLDKDDPDWRQNPGTPKYWMRSNANLDAIRLAPVPDATTTQNALLGEVAVKPSRDATAVEEIFLDRFQNTLINGALARLLSVPSAPWYAPDVAIYHKQLFDMAKDEARMLADGDDTPKKRLLKYGGI
jgi:hypothetical protein